ncbi:MAG: hypothetical protein EOO10_24095, partial [Chitinophagaceae bacterium]
MKNKLFLSVLVGLLILCSSWGFLMHRTITQLSVYQLPTEMQPFFHQNLDYLVRNSPRPDQRRNSDPTEETKHFIDFEAYGKDGPTKMPTKWKAALAKYSEDTLLKYGHVPYWVVVMQDRLTNAFRKRHRDSILFYATDLAHYIEDAHVPLHTTLNYDGQLTDQKGLHSLWESMIPELTLDEFNLKAAKKASYLKNPETAIWKTVRHSYSLVKKVLETERKVSKRFTDSTKYRYQKRNGKDVRSYTRDFALAYGKALEPMVNDQAIRAANLVADFWYTAWVDAGKPDLKKLLRKSWNSSNKTQLQ